MPTIEQQTEAYHVLLHADRFSLGGTGVAGRIREPELSLRVLLKDRDPKYFLTSVLDHATPAGRMYALCGLYYASPESYRSVVERYRNANDTFEWQSGCMVMPGSTFQAMFSVLENGLFAGLTRDRLNRNAEAANPALRRTGAAVAPVAATPPPSPARPSSGHAGGASH